MHNPDGASTRLLQFSSSVVTYQNRATGDATDHDVARRINERAYTVSRFLDPAGTLTGTINGISYISSSGYYSYSSDISCGITPYTYQWAVSSDGWNYTNVSTYPSTSIGIYPGSAYVQSGSLYWRLNIHSADGQNQSLFKYVGVNQSIHLRGGDVSAIANNHYDGFVLTSATPNPVTDQATIEFQVPEKHEIKLELFNEVGQSIKVLEAGEFEAGIYRHKLNTNFLAGGTYMYRLSSGEFSAIKKLTVIK